MNTPITDQLERTALCQAMDWPKECRALERIAGELYKAFNNTCLCPTCKQARTDALARYQAMKNEETK